MDAKILIKNLRDGDEKSFMYLVDKFHRRLYAYCLTLTDDHATAEDIIQNVFINIWHFREKLDSKYSLQSLLYKSVYNEFLKEYEKNKSVMLLKHSYYESINEIVKKTDEEALEKMISLVTKEIKKLPKKCREVFILSKKEGLTNMEISNYLSISIKTVEAHISKAFSILRERLGDEFKTTLFLLFGLPKQSIN